MPLRTPFALLSLSLVAALLAPARAEEAPAEKTKEPTLVRCAAFATSWDAALKDAKARVVPIVVHSHGFYCTGCHKVHAEILCNVAYMDFTYENATEVLVLDSLQEGVDKNEPGAATRDVKVGGKTVQHLVNVPGLTIADVLALNASKAGTYNTEGRLPYTCLVDPWTEAEMQAWKGWKVTADEIRTGITEAREKLRKDHGKGKPRAELKAFDEGAATSALRLKNGDFAGALDAYAVLQKRCDKEGWAVRMLERLELARAEVVAAATKALDEWEAGKDADLVKAKKDLLALQPRLRGTGLEKRAKELLATL
jgi:hypothetical protein